MKKVSVSIFILITFSIIYSVQLNAQNDCSAEIKNLQQQIQAIREGSIQNNSNSANVITNIQEVQSQIEALKGSIEANAHQISSYSDRVDVKLSDMDTRLASVEERLEIHGKQVTSAISAMAPETAKEAELYQIALSQVNNAEYLKAIATLTKFQSKFPKSEYASNVQYWMGDCYFAMRDYERAIKEFQKLQDKYPRSEKIPAALLRQAYSFSELGMDNEANLFYNTLVSKYPRSREAAEARQWKEKSKPVKASETTPKNTGDVPLAPGVQTPSQEKKHAQEKYR